VGKRIPFFSIFFALSTLAVSTAVATAASGRPWSEVRILKLHSYGAVDNADLSRGEWWRLLTAQFVHVKPAHMLLNVAMLFLLAVGVERAAGSLALALLWLLSGSAGVYASTYSVQPPYDIGSGASQAIMGVAGAAIVVIRRNPAYPSWFKGALVATLGITAALDLLFSRSIKIGHVVSLLVGWIVAIAVVPKTDSIAVPKSFSR
jgi:rhomboid protease GluP